MTKQLPFILLITLLPFTRISSQQADNLQHLWFPVRVEVFDRYPFLYPLTKNMAGVCDGRSHYFLIDRKGRRLLTDTFTHIAEIQYPSQTHFLVWKNDKLFLLNSQLQLTEIQSFENFTWLPANQVFRFTEGDFYGLMHTDGTVLRQPAFDYLQEINGQIITTRHLKYGALSRNGSELIPTVFDEIRVADNGYFTVRQKDKTAVFAPDGRQLTNFEFDMAQIRPDGSFFARNARDKDGSFTLFQKDGVSTGESNWRRTSDSNYTYWLLPGRKYAEQYDFQGNLISQKFPADSVF